MGFRQGLNDWLSILIKFGVIVIVAVGILWICISGYGNWKLSQINAPPPDPPVITDDYDEIIIKATNQRLYSDSVILLRSNPFDAYKVSGYYELVNKKWIYRDNEILFDEEYYGEIIVNKR